jgi:hypothetical protein
MYSRVPLLFCRYGMHLSKEQVAELVAPHPDTLELVNSWVEYHGIPSSSVSTTHGGGWLTFIGVPVSRANERHYYPHGWLCTPSGVAHTRTICRAYNVLCLYALATADAEKALRAAEGQAKAASGARDWFVETRWFDLAGFPALTVQDD